MGKKYQPSCKKELKELLEKDVCLGDIDTSLITDMTELFLRSKRKNFDGLETWDTSNVTTMKGMFYRAKYFNHPIGDWDVSKVEDMSYMFCEAPAFNQPLEKWDVSNVKDMMEMFCAAKSFNQPLNAWDVSNVKNMYNIIYSLKQRRSASLIRRGTLRVLNEKNLSEDFPVDNVTVFVRKGGVWKIAQVMEAEFL